jgi:AcrR family transcriptional regulator
MPPKQQYSREDVIKAAVKVVEQAGIKRLTARRVAGQLGSSTAPVYKHFSHMDDLALEVMRSGQRLLLKYSARPYTDRLFLNMGTGVAMFALEHSLLYRALLLEGDEYRDLVAESLEIMRSEMGRDEELAPLPLAEQRRLLDKMWTYTHGLASLICTGFIKGCNQDLIIRSLMDVGADVIGATLAKHRDKEEAEGE